MLLPRRAKEVHNLHVTKEAGPFQKEMRGVGNSSKKDECERTIGLLNSVQYDASPDLGPFSRYLKRKVSTDLLDANRLTIKPLLRRHFIQAVPQVSKETNAVTATYKGRRGHLKIARRLTVTL